MKSRVQGSTSTIYIDRKSLRLRRDWYKYLTQKDKETKKLNNLKLNQHE